MDSRRRHFVSIYLTGVACALALIACEPSTQSSTQAEPPSLDPPILRTEPVKLSVDTLDEFLVYAATSPVSERETVRKMVSEQAGNEEIGIALQKSFQTTVGDDFDFALVQLSVLGELRAENSIPFFTEILTRKVRDGTRDLEHGLSERDMLNMLQVKAVQGLAYLQNPEADEVVLETAAEHHSRAVRSAAVQAMLYNAGDKDGTRARLEKVLRQEDRSLLDLVRRTPSTEKEEFNNQLAEYYRKYPEEVATAPGEPTGQTAAEYRDEEDSRDEAAKPQRADK